MAERLDKYDFLMGLRKSWAKPILMKIPLSLLHDLDFQFNEIPLVTDHLIKDNGKITTDDVLKVLDEQLKCNEGDDIPKSVRVTDEMYRQNRNRIKDLLDQFYPDTGSINQGSSLHEIISDFIKSTSK